MRLLDVRENEKHYIDIHGMNKIDAKYQLERLIVKIDPSIKEIVVIHGYHFGNTLKNMVRNELKSRHIAGRILSLNQGITSLIIEKTRKS